MTVAYPLPRSFGWAEPLDGCGPWPHLRALGNGSFFSPARLPLADGRSLLPFGLLRSPYSEPGSRSISPLLAALVACPPRRWIAAVLQPSLLLPCLPSEVPSLASLASFLELLCGFCCSSFLSLFWFDLLTWLCLEVLCMQPSFRSLLC